jgi:hypothetical protein
MNKLELKYGPKPKVAMLTICEPPEKELKLYIDESANEPLSIIPGIGMQFPNREIVISIMVRQIRTSNGCSVFKFFLKNSMNNKFIYLN